MCFIAEVNDRGSFLVVAIESVFVAQLQTSNERDRNACSVGNTFLCSPK